MTIILYEHPASPYCRSVKLLANLIKVPLDVQFVNLLAKEQYSDQYLQKNPFHKVPSINDHGFYLSESRAIVTYLIETYAPDHVLYPKDVKTRAVIDQMLYFDSGTFSPAMSGLTRPLVYNNTIPGPEAYEKAKEVIKTLDDVLAKNKFAAGDNLTVADLCLRATYSINELLGTMDTSEFKNVNAWAERVRNDTSPEYGEVNDAAIATFSEFLRNKLDQLTAESKLKC